ncbi:STAS domain-containing protein [Iodobacter ciconiae]|uniref:Anti-sigma factor antagonist n=1 Tax=Iodobacter ciconiae TaxID=2496266 RepID=A0A3S8ZSJ7_9NEIS|nr:STAS domain-containing protein [Iodobacter ciconiae]AZN36391.1 anti-sigma factor antagonist [Iodobacter ciconiae]
MLHQAITTGCHPMPITHKIQNDLCTILIRGEISIYTSKLMQETLLELLQSEHIIHIDLSEVNEIDSAGIQLLISLKKYAHNKKTTLQFQEHSLCVLDVIDLYNIAAELGDPLVLTQR